ncbi:MULTISPECIES: phytoene desaturase family protein [Methanosarcina]|uniref:Phytoene dehydrogenase family protein n=3 Tax=Methanosarcina barkeri TaxID=2208 RepID=A0A0G3C7E6_METBA|nr:MULTISPECIES: NAD(P)/FAD-dependent oxidoreductase [Methanosarcina]AKB54563.1 putative oxidoreductase [Methanosarcina barkeri MS]AKB57360.1 putative oxidoreductase [Methanosarcina barkeri 227]AKJ37919.1 phytoene dehydrogenase family protein [Methanosarcina barkeri CM1]OED10290.1 phytoene dehydrogenase [Methanosarcina sp. A14]
MKAIVIGAGLGGLLSAARLSKAGYQVDVFERLPITGGRFTNLPYKGFQLSSGAFHILPHGPAGPLAKFLKEVGADVKIVRSDDTIIRVPQKKGIQDYEKGFKDISFTDFSTLLSHKERLKIALLIVSTRKNRPTGSSLQAWIRSQFKDEWLVRFADAFCGWALSLKSDEVPVEEIFEIIENMYRFGGPGVPIGGCKGIIDALESVIAAHDGKIHTETEVSKILVENGKAAGVLVGEEAHKADLVISNLGHAATACLCAEALSGEKASEYLQRLETLKPSAGIKICLAAGEPLVGHSGVLLTPYAKRVNGINEVTQVDPKLAPPGKHLTMSHQYVAPENVKNLEAEIELGLKDLKNIFPNKKYEVLLIQSYHDSWPVNRAASGTDPGNETPVPGLYVVGDGAKGKGGIEVEGVALGVAATMKKILE